MKLISLLSRIAAIATVAFGLGIAFNQNAVAFYSIVASAFVLLIVAADYGPRARRFEPKLAVAPCAQNRTTSQRLQLAA